MPGAPGPGGWGRGAGGRRLLPEWVRKELKRRRRVPNTVSMSFEETKEMPTSVDFGRWLIDQKLSPSNGFDVKRLSRSEHDSKFYMQLEREETVENFLKAVGEEGREWKEP